MSRRPAHTFYLWLLQVIILSLLLLFFLWLTLRPSSPSFTLTNFSINTTTSNNASSISFSIDFSNDNKRGRVYYDKINIAVYSRNASIATTRVDAFDQGHEKSSSVSGEVFGGGREWDEVVKVIERRRRVRLRVELVAAVRYRIWLWRSRWHWMDVEAGISVGFGGKISGRRKKIKMHRAQN